MLIDIHAHVLPGLDDGPATMDETLQMARAFVADGTGVVFATSHGFSRHYHAEPDEIRAAVVRVNEMLTAHALPLSVLPGMEVHYHQRILETFERGDAIGYGGEASPRHMLLELSLREWPQALADTLYELRLRGTLPILAHAERYPELQRHPERLLGIVREGALVQVTAGSILGEFGGVCERLCHRWLREGLVHVIASDAHDSVARKPGIRPALERVAGPWRLPDAAQACERTAGEILRETRRG